MEKETVDLNCMVCGKEFKGEEPQMCCSGRDCGCMGMPSEPIVCSEECYNKLHERLPNLPKIETVTSPMNKDLLAPRFKVIADYPCQMFQIGHIINTHESAMAYVAEGDGWSEKVCLADYPSLFRRLYWWENREPEDMPEFIKYNGSGIVAKPYSIDYETGWFYTNEVEYNATDYNELSKTTPATLADYTNYINSLKDKK